MERKKKKHPVPDKMFYGPLIVSILDKAKTHNEK